MAIQRFGSRAFGLTLLLASCGGTEPAAKTAAAPSAPASAAATSHGEATGRAETAATAAPPSEVKGAAPAASAVTTAGFTDSAKHYRDANAVDEYPRHAEDQIPAIAANILLHQRESGGWATNWDPRRILSADEVAQIQADKSKIDTSFDNRTTYTQIDYLAQAHHATRDSRFRDGAVRGIEFTLKAQHSSGGFPHSFPGKEDYHHHITFMDDVMPGVLGMLRRAAQGAEPYEFLDADQRKRIAAALRRGDACVLQLQVVVDGKPTVWAGQYDAATLKPANARAFELPSLVSDESVAVVEYLMTIEQPTPQIRRGVEAAVNWFERSKIEGLRIEKFDVPHVRYKYHTSTYDLRAVADPTAPPLWARFYELETNRPFMANRDGIKVYSLDLVERERRTGYRWYGEFAKKLLERDYPEWKQRSTPASGKAAAAAGTARP